MPLDLLWWSTKTIPTKNIYLVEGIIKGIILSTVSKDVDVVAHPLSHISAETAVQLSGHNIVYFLDPEIRGEVLDDKVGLLRAAGNEVTPIYLPDNWKIDDLILAYPDKWRYMCSRTP